MMKKFKITILIGGIVLLAWLMLLPLGFITGEILKFSTLFILSGVIMTPVFLGLIKAMTGEEKVNKIEGGIVLLCSGGIFFSGLGVVFYQIYGYLRQGKWVGVSVVDGLIIFNFPWARQPNDWLGVWKVLNSIPLSLALIVLAFLVWAASIKGGDQNSA